MGTNIQTLSITVAGSFAKWVFLSRGNSESDQPRLLIALHSLQRLTGRRWTDDRLDIILLFFSSSFPLLLAYLEDLQICPGNRHIGILWEEKTKSLSCQTVFSSALSFPVFNIWLVLSAFGAPRGDIISQGGASRPSELIYT
jgi:hypothetical protein